MGDDHDSPARPASAGDVASLAALRAGALGGAVAFEVDPAQCDSIGELYDPWMATLDAFAFWRAAKSGTYRPENGLWLPQRRAVAFAHAYLAAWKAGAADG